MLQSRPLASSVCVCTNLVTPITSDALTLVTLCMEKQALVEHTLLSSSSSSISFYNFFSPSDEENALEIDSRDNEHKKVL